MRSTTTALIPVLAALAAGCTPRAALSMVRTQATYDLDCPGKDIRIEEELGGHFKAVGCGHKARYRAACDGLGCVVQPEDGPTIPWRDRRDRPVRE